MSEQAPRSIEERTQFEYKDVEDYMKDDIAAQRREQAMAVYDGNRAAAKNASARARRREQKLEQMQDLQSHLESMDNPHVGKHERVSESPVDSLVHPDDRAVFDAESVAEDLPGVYSGDVFYNESSQTVLSIGESRKVGEEEVVKVVTETKLANGKTKKAVREMPRAKAVAFAESLDVNLIEPGYERLYAAEESSELGSEEAEPAFEQGGYIMMNGELFKIEAVGDLTDQGDRFVRLMPAYGNNPQPVDTTERALIEANAAVAPETELQRLDFNNAMDAIVANVIGGVMTIEEAKQEVIVLGKKTNRPQEIIDYYLIGLPALIDMEPSHRATLDDYDDIFVPNTSETTTPAAGKTLGERLREARQRPLISEDDTDLPADKSVMDKIKDAQLQAVANAQAALNVASEKARSNNHERKNSRKWIIAAAGIGALAVALFVGSKYGFSLKPNAEAAQAAQDAADTAGKQVEKLTRVQQALISAPGKYPYGHYEHVYGADAAEQLHKAVRRLHAAGVKVIEHGSGRDYWVEVPTKNGAGMTSNTKRVVEVLATGRV